MRSTMNPTNMRFWAVTVALAAVALSGCVGGADAQSSIYVKDALTDDAAEVHVTFTKAQVKLQGGTWMTVYEGKKTIELLSLSAADAREELAAFDLAPGAYEGLRLAVSEVTVVGHDGSETLLNVFGNIVSVADDFTVSEDGIDILVDFDLESGVDLAAGTYTPLVKTVQTSDDDHDGDGVDDVRDADDDDDGVDDHEDDDRDGDGEDDEPRQHHGASTEELCAAEREEELADEREDLNESLRDAQQKRDERLAEHPGESGEAWSEYNETVAEAQREYDEEVAEAHAEHDECLREDEDDDHDEDRDDDHGGHGRNGTDDHDEEDDHDEDGSDDSQDGRGEEGEDDDRRGSDDGSDEGSEDDSSDSGDDEDDAEDDDSSGSGSGDGEEDP